MSKSIANVDGSVDTFDNLFMITNQIATAISNEVITANSSYANTIGNAQLLGVFGANTLIVTDNLRGGNVSSNGALVISSNTSIGGTLVISGSIESQSDINANGNITPSANGKSLGNTTSRWVVRAVNVNSSGSIQANGSVSFSNTLGVTGPVTFANTLNVNGAVTLANTLNVTGAVTFSNTVSFASIGFSSLKTGDLTIKANTVTISNTSANLVIDSFPLSEASFAKYFITVADTSISRHAIEMILLHEGSNIIITKYGELFNTSMGTFGAVINGANVDILFSATSANSTNQYTIKSARTEF